MLVRAAKQVRRVSALALQERSASVSSFDKSKANGSYIPSSVARRPGFVSRVLPK
jgi:hypothetical protein